MEARQGTGRDTRVMMPVLACLFMVAAELFLPWFSAPELKYQQLPDTYSLWRIEECVENTKQFLGGENWAADSQIVRELESLLSYADIMKLYAVFLIFLLCAGAAFAYWKRGESVWFVKLTFFCAGMLPIAAFWGIFLGNRLVDRMIGREHSFFNYTIYSFLQLTAFPYAQLLLSVILFFAAGALLDTTRENSAQLYISRTGVEDTGLGKRTKLSVFIILCGIPAVILFGIFFLNDRSESFIALCIIGLAMLPFAMVFEARRPQARELLLIAVMASIAVVGRMAFFMLPQFKPVTAIVIITGVSLGAEAGFLTGAMTGFVSNFFFGQGPWTPWQMFAFGIIGFLAGLFFRGKRKNWSGNKYILCVYGGLATFVIYGGLMDFSSVFSMAGGFDLKSLLAIFASGIPFNIVHGISTVVFLFVLAKPMTRKLGRIKKKYGIMEAG